MGNSLSPDSVREAIRAQGKKAAAEQAKKPEAGQRCFLGLCFGRARDEPKTGDPVAERSRHQGYGMQAVTDRRMREAGLDP